MKLLNAPFQTSQRLKYIWKKQLIPRTSKMGPKHMGKNNVFINDAGQISETLLEV